MLSVELDALHPDVLRSLIRESPSWSLDHSILLKFGARLAQRPGFGERVSAPSGHGRSLPAGDCGVMAGARTLEEVHQLLLLSDHLAVLRPELSVKQSRCNPTSDCSR